MKKEESLSIKDSSSFEERLSFNLKLNDLITRKKREKVKPLISDNVVRINFTKSGINNLSKLKNSVVVKQNQKLIKTSKVITFITPKSLKKVSFEVKKDKKILNQALMVKKIIDKKVKEYKKKLFLLKEKYDKLNSLVSKAYTKEKVKELVNEMTNLKKEIIILKKQCLLIADLHDFDDVSLLNNEKLSDLSSLLVRKMSEDDIKLLADACKKDLDYIENLLTLVDKTNYLDYELLKKEAEVDAREDDFKKEKDETSDLSKLEKEIVSKMNEEVNKTNDLIDKIESFGNKEDNLSIEELQEIADDYINYILKTDFLVKIFRFLKSILNKKDVTKKIDDRAKLIKKIYSDYEAEITNEIDSLNDVSNNIKKSLDQLNWLKDIFYKKFYKYKDLIKEYDDIYNKLELLEEKLLSNYEIINVNKKKLDEQKVKIKEKMN